jgi:hypothetical protein
MAPRKSPINKKVTLRFDQKALSLIESLEIPAVSTIAAKVRYLTMRGIETVQ